MNTKIVNPWPLPFFVGEGGGSGGDAQGAGGDGKGGAAAAAAAGAAKPAAQSAMGSDGGNDDGSAAAAAAKDGKLPDNWRTLFAGGDAAALKELERFTDPSKIGSTLLNYKKQMRSGSFDTPPPPADKAEELKAWREEHGIPLDVAGYKVPEPVQKRLVAEDKPILEGYIAAAHAKNQPQSVIDGTTEGDVDMQEKTAAAIVEKDKTEARNTEDALRGEWGQSYRPNFTAAQRAMKEFFPNIDWTEARLPDGRKLGSIPDVVKGAHELAINKWGAGEFVGQEATARSTSRMAEIEAIMREDISKYTPELRKEYGELIAAQEKANARR